MTANPTLADVNARRAAIASERQTIAQRDRELAAEDNELAIAARVLERMAAATDQVEQISQRIAVRIAEKEAEVQAKAETSVTTWEEFKAHHNITDKTSIEDTISICLLASKIEWHTSSELQDWLSKIRGRDVPMSSISPTLSNMKTKGVIIRDGLKVALAARVSTPPQQTGELSLSP